MEKEDTVYSVNSNFQYIAPDWVIGKIFRYWFLGLSPSSFPSAVLSVRGTTSSEVKAPRCLGNQDRLTPENTVQLPWGHRGGCGAIVPSPNPITSFCSCTRRGCRNDVLEEVIECFCVWGEIRGQARDGSLQRVWTPALRGNDELLSSDSSCCSLLPTLQCCSGLFILF